MGLVTIRSAFAASGQYLVSVLESVGAQETVSGGAPVLVSASDAGVIADTATGQVPTDLPADMDFYAPWATDTGTGSDALSDGGKWDTSVPTHGSEIIASTGLGFPCTNVLRVDGSQSAVDFCAKTGLTLPEVGERVVYRVYYRNVLPVSWTGDMGNHSMQDGNAGSDCNWMWDTEVDQDSGTFELTIQMDNGGSNSGNYRFVRLTPFLSKATTYRLELMIHRLGTNTFRPHARVFDVAVSDTVPAYTDADFTGVNGSGSLLDNPTLNFNNFANMEGWRIGTNGWEGAAPGPDGTVWYWGAPARRLCASSVSEEDAWVGPFNQAEEA